MTLDAKTIVDRRRLKRRLSVWRLVAIVGGFVAVLAVVYATSDTGVPFARKDHVAAIRFNGLLTGRAVRTKLLRDVAKEKSAKALILRINSPGGTTAGSEALYEEIRKVAAKKPVVAVMSTVAASGGYIVALGADHIIARGNSITGSIGVIFQWAQVDKALNSLGVSVKEIKSSPLKASPSPFTPTSDQAIEVTKAMVMDSYRWFVDLVAERRPFDRARALVLADGRVYTGRQAIEVKLVDQLGGEEQAREWLAKNRSINADLKIVDWQLDEASDLGIGFRLLSWAAGKLGLSQAVNLLRQGNMALVGDQVRLDGLLSVWQP
ncbi:MAG: signal peptide peptidase SppA [Alphaproteobacteria bacterium]